MVKLGDAYFDETSIVAIMPVLTSEEPVTRYTVCVAGGHFYLWDADAAKVQRRLEEVGLIEPQSAPLPDFTKDEQAELRDYSLIGFDYAAKDEDGCVYAYSKIPSKGKHSWLNDDSVSRVTRLTAGRYAALAFTDECPLDIAVALKGVLRC